MKPRPIRIEGDVAYVPLTRGYEAIIDAADAEMVGRHNWYAHHSRDGLVYAARTVRGVDGDWRKVRGVFLHRLLSGRDGLEVDHRDGDTLNDRRSNLREATRAQNGKNRKPHRKASSLPTGVRRQSGGRFEARVTSDGKRHVLGTFDTPELAHAAYVEAAQRLHGEFARAS